MQFHYLALSIMSIWCLFYLIFFNFWIFFSLICRNYHFSCSFFKYYFWWIYIFVFMFTYTLAKSFLHSFLVSFLCWLCPERLNVLLVIIVLRNILIKKEIPAKSLWNSNKFGCLYENKNLKFLTQSILHTIKISTGIFGRFCHKIQCYRHAQQWGNLLSCFCNKEYMGS